MMVIVTCYHSSLKLILNFWPKKWQPSKKLEGTKEIGEGIEGIQGEVKWLGKWVGWGRMMNRKRVEERKGGVERRKRWLRGADEEVVRCTNQI